MVLHKPMGNISVAYFSSCIQSDGWIPQPILDMKLIKSR